MKPNDKHQTYKTIKNESNKPLEIELRRSKKDMKETNIKDDFYTFLIEGP